MYQIFGDSRCCFRGNKGVCYIIVETYLLLYYYNYYYHFNSFKSLSWWTHYYHTNNFTKSPYYLSLQSELIYCTQQLIWIWEEKKLLYHSHSACQLYAIRLSHHRSLTIIANDQLALLLFLMFDNPLTQFNITTNVCNRFSGMRRVICLDCVTN